ncbi:MAG TPA: DUF892 family protein [Terriglobales bacterium]|nr:DUF892 family protein [Terriglobales bacterium]
MERVSLRGLYISELKKSHDVEIQLISALETAAQASSSVELRQTFEHHLEQTKDHATRLQMILEMTGETPQVSPSVAMKGLTADLKQLQQQGLADGVLDSALIAHARRIEHYEIAMYGTLHNYATALGECDTASQLQTTLEEEQEADRQFTKIGQTINRELAAKDAGEPSQPCPEAETTTRIKPAA